MNDTLLHQADALMHRRSFVAGAKPAEAPADETAAAEANDFTDFADLPVLTEVVDPQAAAAPVQSAAEKTLDELIDTTLDERIADKLREQQAQIDREVEAWLDEQLPQLVARAVNSIAEEMTEQLRTRLAGSVLRSRNYSSQTNGEHSAAD